MPFQSEKQRRWMWSNDPEMAEDWEDEKKWQKILKNKLISVPKQKTHIRKPKSGTDMDKCKDKLVQLNEKLKNMDLSHTFHTIEVADSSGVGGSRAGKILFPAKRVNARYRIEKDEHTPGDVFYETFQVTDYTLLDNDRMPIYSIGIYHELFIEDIPEQVACKALEMLEKNLYSNIFHFDHFTINISNSADISTKKLWIWSESIPHRGPFICDMGIRSKYLVGDATKWELMMHKELIDQWTEKMKSKLEWWK